MAAAASSGFLDAKHSTAALAAAASETAGAPDSASAPATAKASKAAVAPAKATAAPAAASASTASASAAHPPVSSPALDSAILRHVATAITQGVKHINDRASQFSFTKGIDSNLANVATQWCKSIIAELSDTIRQYVVEKKSAFVVPTATPELWKTLLFYGVVMEPSRSIEADILLLVTAVESPASALAYPSTVSAFHAEQVRRMVEEWSRYSTLCDIHSPKLKQFHTFHGTLSRYYGELRTATWEAMWTHPLAVNIPIMQRLNFPMLDGIRLSLIAQKSPVVIPDASLPRAKSATIPATLSAKGEIQNVLAACQRQGGADRMAYDVVIPVAIHTLTRLVISKEYQELFHVLSRTWILSKTFGANIQISKLKYNQWFPEMLLERNSVFLHVDNRADLLSSLEALMNTINSYQTALGALFRVYDGTDSKTKRPESTEAAMAVLETTIQGPVKAIDAALERLKKTTDELKRPSGASDVPPEQLCAAAIHEIQTAQLSRARILLKSRASVSDVLLRAEAFVVQAPLRWHGGGLVRVRDEVARLKKIQAALDNETQRNNQDDGGDGSLLANTQLVKGTIVEVLRLDMVELIKAVDALLKVFSTLRGASLVKAFENAVKDQANAALCASTEYLQELYVFCFAYVSVLRDASVTRSVHEQWSKVAASFRRINDGGSLRVATVMNGWVGGDQKLDDDRKGEGGYGWSKIALSDSGLHVTDALRTFGAVLDVLRTNALTDVDTERLKGINAASQNLLRSITELTNKEFVPEPWFVSVCEASMATNRFKAVCAKQRQRCDSAIAGLRYGLQRAGATYSIPLSAMPSDVAMNPDREFDWALLVLFGFKMEPAASLDPVEFKSFQRVVEKVGRSTIDALDQLKKCVFVFQKAYQQPLTDELIKNTVNIPPPGPARRLTIDQQLAHNERLNLRIPTWTLYYIGRCAQSAHFENPSLDKPSLSQLSKVYDSRLRAVLALADLAPRLFTS